MGKDERVGGEVTSYEFLLFDDYDTHGRFL